jgi:uncharacterized protein
MLGGLARWLRLAGLDTAFDPRLDDPELKATARHEGRWLLTRDRALAATAGPRVVLLHAADTNGQLEELLRRLALEVDPRQFFTRCSRCNGELAAVARETVAELLPPFVAAHESRFVRCGSCGQVYWPGTHHARILARLEALMEQATIVRSSER